MIKLPWPWEFPAIALDYGVLAVTLGAAVVLKLASDHYDGANVMHVKLGNKPWFDVKIIDTRKQEKKE